jgi:diguanylate cyclase (GGDEF)-like protein
LQHLPIGIYPKPEFLKNKLILRWENPYLILWLRPGDLVARYGGDEFVFVMPNTKAEGALSIANLMRREVESLQIPHKGSEVGEYVTISIGVTTSLCFDINREEPFEIADQALSQAKEDSDKFVAFLEPQLDYTNDNG